MRTLCFQTWLLLFFMTLSCNPVEVEVKDSVSAFRDSKTLIGKGDFVSWKDGLACQGCAIYNGIIYETRHSGFCDLYELKGEKISYKTTIRFKSGSDDNHFNCVQFDSMHSDDEAPILYISSHKRKTPCFVERIVDNDTQLLQSIYVEDMEEVPSQMYFNLVPGDDDDLWMCGFFDTTLRIIRMRRPLLSHREYTLSKDDILDMWDRENYVWEEEVLQGMKYYNNRLYVAYGGGTGRRGVWIWDTATHTLLHNIDLTDITKTEFEDVEISNNYLYIFVLADYILRFDLNCLSLEKKFIYDIQCQ